MKKILFAYCCMFGLVGFAFGKNTTSGNYDTCGGITKCNTATKGHTFLCSLDKKTVYDFFTCKNNKQFEGWFNTSETDNGHGLLKYLDLCDNNTAPNNFINTEDILGHWDLASSFILYVNKNLQVGTGTIADMSLYFDFGNIPPKQKVSKNQACLICPSNSVIIENYDPAVLDKEHYSLGVDSYTVCYPQEFAWCYYAAKEQPNVDFEGFPFPGESDFKCICKDIDGEHYDFDNTTHKCVKSNGTRTGKSTEPEEPLELKEAKTKLDSFFSYAKANRSGWKTADGKFNTTRLASDITAGVVLGTVGGVVSGVVIKKKQVEKGFEALHCTVGGQKVADWGDEFSVGFHR